MTINDETELNHSHSFGQEHKRPGESRTIIVIVVTAVMMVVEIAAGMLFGSMALLADGLHMASHAAALSISAFAYIYARRHAHDERFSFGTGKVNALGGFSGAADRLSADPERVLRDADWRTGYPQLRSRLRGDEVILLKASRGVALEGMIDLLEADDGPDEGEEAR